MLNVGLDMVCFFFSIQFNSIQNTYGGQFKAGGVVVHGYKQAIILSAQPARYWVLVNLLIMKKVALLHRSLPLRLIILWLLSPM